MFKAIKDAFTNLFAFIKGSLANLKTRISTNFGKATSYFGSFFRSNAANAADGSFVQNQNDTEITTPKNETIEATLSDASAALNQAQDDVEETFESVVDTAAEVKQELGQDVKETIESVVDTAAETKQEFVQDVEATLENQNRSRSNSPSPRV